jgi:patatin-like phospholipase/acyl hydrolase
METILREKTGNPNYVLSDYFDLIGGTSTGSIIAALLALGKSVDEIAEMYMTLGGKIFGDKRNWWNPLETFKFIKATYGEQNLEDELKKNVGDITLGSDQLKTGLCIVCKRADTNSTWPLINHPKGKYYPQNKDILLWQALRASSAAPSYFVPKMIDVGGGQIGAFVDGGVSMANNPSLTLLMVATVKGFPFHWETGEENLSLYSVGTGYTEFHKRTQEIDDAWLLSWASAVPNMLMQDASWQNQIVLQWLSNSPTAKKIDSEIGNLEGDLISTKPILNYYRFNVCISEENLNSFGFDRTFDAHDVENIAEMSNSENRYLLYDIGKKAAEMEINPNMFSV